jgi:hypothetical protein
VDKSVESDGNGDRQIYRLEVIRINVRQVPVDYVAAIWPRVAGMIEAAMEHSAGEYTAEQLRVFLAQGIQTLLVAEENGDIRGAATISFINYPNDRIAFVTSIGGRMIANKDVWRQFEGWCRAMGATKVQGAAFEAVARLWRRRFGTKTVYFIVEKNIREAQ